MVHFKITNGIETRRFQVNPGELTFEQLQERISTLFPEATKGPANLSLRYRDAEGDIITLSSDQEFQEALSDLPADHVWKLHVTSPRVKREQQKPCQRASLLDHILQPSWSAFGVRRNPWSECDRQLQETQELVDLLFGLHAPSTSEATAPHTSEDKDTTAPSTSEDKDTTAPSTSEDRGQNESNDSANPDATESHDSSETAPKEGEEEEVKSKLSGGDKKETEKTSSSQCPAGHHCHVKRIEFREPLLFGGLFGPTLPGAFSPVQGYRITWTPRAQGCC